MTGKRVAAALAFVAASLWALLRFCAKPAPVSELPAAVPASAPEPEPAGAPKRASQKSIASSSAPAKPAKVRGAALREKGEALGGTPP